MLTDQQQALLDIVADMRALTRDFHARLDDLMARCTSAGLSYADVLAATDMTGGYRVDKDDMTDLALSYVEIINREPPLLTVELRKHKEVALA